MRQRDKYIPELAEVELELLREGVSRVHGVDPGEHGMDPLRAAVWQAMEQSQTNTVSGLQEKLLHETEALEEFLAILRLEVTPKEAGFLAHFRNDLVPLFRTYPFIRIWQAGCRSVFESYALAIILLEEGVYEKSTVYTTDVDALSLCRARDGLFPMSELPEYERIYRESGGRAELKRYCHEGEESGTFEAGLRRNMVFAQHDFATDDSINEFTGIFCRRRLTGMDRVIRQRAEQTLSNSLVLLGILGLPAGETLERPGVGDRFVSIDHGHNLYRKTL